MKWKKTSIQDKQRIIEEKINTMKPASEIARDLGLNERTTQHILKQNFTEICGESSKVAELIDRNNELQSMADALLKELIQSKDVKAWELVQVKKTAWEQNQVMSDKPTANVKVDWYSLIQKYQNWELSKDNAYEIHNQLKDLKI